MRNDIPLTVTGNLVEDPELRLTPNGIPVARFTIASTPRTFDREADTWRDGEPTFLDCTVWRQLAENLVSSARKGTRLVVAGRLRTERWETPEGEKRSKMVMEADEVAASMMFATVAITGSSNFEFSGGAPLVGSAAWSHSVSGGAGSAGSGSRRRYALRA